MNVACESPCGGDQMARDFPCVGVRGATIQAKAVLNLF